MHLREDLVRLQGNFARIVLEDKETGEVANLPMCWIEKVGTKSVTCKTSSSALDRSKIPIKQIAYVEPTFLEECRWEAWPKSADARLMEAIFDEEKV